MLSSGILLFPLFLLLLQPVMGTKGGCVGLCWGRSLTTGTISGAVTEKGCKYRNLRPHLTQTGTLHCPPQQELMCPCLFAHPSTPSGKCSFKTLISVLA